MSKVKIYESTEYVENNKVGDLKLEVISQWDFKSKAVCYQTIKSMGGDNLLVPYKLVKTVHVNEDGKGWRTEPVEVLTKEEIEELESMGCRVAEELKGGKE